MSTSVGRGRLFRFLTLAASAAVLVPAVAQAELPGCGGCREDLQPCLLTYGAAGVVRDAATALPIAGATVTVLDLTTVSAADGSYAVSGTRTEACHLDYFWSLTATAEGYEPAQGSYYATHTNPGGLEIRLQPVEGATEFPVSGVVAEFPFCYGRMRGVTVTLEPLGLSTQTSLGPDGGRFSFDSIPPGSYTLVVSPPCNPFGCWRDTPVVVVDEFVTTEVCMEGPTLTPPPTPTRTPTPDITPCAFPTAPLCPIGHEPDCISNECIVGCGCKPCPPCDPGLVYSGAPNSCLCVSVPPTPTNTPCPGATQTPCPLGERPSHCAPEACNAGCGCQTCPSCPAGQLLAPRYNVCECVPDPAYTPPTPRPTPTPDVCPLRPTRCPDGQRPSPCEEPCGLHCGCDVCPPCGDGEVTAHGPNFCRCTNAPDITPTLECVGDCDGNDVVSVPELVMMVRAALDGIAVPGCAAAEVDGGTAVQITEVMMAVHDALTDCAVP